MNRSELNENEKKLLDTFSQLDPEDKKEFIAFTRLLIAEPDSSHSFALVDEIIQDFTDGNIAYYQTHTVDEMIQEFVRKTGYPITELAIHEFTWAYNQGLKITARRMAERDTLSA